jgi:cytochrome P450
MLAIHPHIQDTLYAEVRSTIGSRKPTYDDFLSFVYPLCIVLEILRLFPPVCGIPKTVEKDQLLLNNYLVPPGATIMYSTPNLHRNEKYWGKDANEFRPERFDGRAVDATKRREESQRDTGDTAPGALSDKIKMPVKGAFVPFSEGSRSCLGNYPLRSLLFFE